MSVNKCNCAVRLEDKDKRSELIRVLYAAPKISKNTTIIAIFSELNQNQCISFNTIPSVISPGLNFFCLCKIKGHPLIDIKISTDINLKLERIQTKCNHKETFRLKYYKHGKMCKEKNQVPKLTSLSYQTAYANGLTDKTFEKLIANGDLPRTLWRYRYMRFSHLNAYTMDQLFNMKFWINNRMIYTCKDPKNHLGVTFL